MAFRFFIVIADLQPRTTGLPYTSFRIARKGHEGIGKVVFPNGEFSTLTTRGDIGRVSFQERLLRTVTPSSWEAGDAWRELLESGRFRA